jgi:cytochrome P450
MAMASRPPGPPGRLSALAFIVRSGGRLEFLQRFTERYGDVVFFELPGAPPFAILNHPDYVRDVLITRHRQFHKGVGLERAKLLLGEGLLTSEDDFHARQRRLLLPAFHRERIATYAGTMAEYARRRSEGWTEGAVVDVLQEMAALTLAIAGKTLFDADVEGDAATIGEALTTSLASFNLVLLPFGDRLAKMPIPPARRFARARARLDAIIYRLIAERRASGRAGGRAGDDVLSMLVSARDVERDNAGMTDEQIRDEVLTLLLAGHETTANALTWTWYLLSSNPEAETRLHAELDAVLAGRPPGPDDLPRLPYARAVLAESMRLYPPAYLVGRRALEPYDVPGTGYVLPAGTVVFLSEYLLQRDPRFWDDPERFLPERWLAPGARADQHRHVYFPFGAGPRICIGEHFAWMEVTLVLATIAQRWRLRLAPGQKIALQPIITLRPKHGMRMSLERRAPVSRAAERTASGNP